MLVDASCHDTKTMSKQRWAFVTALHSFYDLDIFRVIVFSGRTRRNVFAGISFP